MVTPMYNPELGCDRDFETAEKEDARYEAEQARLKEQALLQSCPFGEELPLAELMEKLANRSEPHSELDALIEERYGVKVWRDSEVAA